MIRRAHPPAGILASSAANVLLWRDLMQNTFTHKLLMTAMAGFAGACLLYAFRHIVQQAFYESNEGWKKSLYEHSTPPPRMR
jgi:hypothetical protein